MMATTTDLPVTILDPTAPHTHTVVFLHGRGDTAAQFAASLPLSPDSRAFTLPEAFPSFRWVSPQAPTRSLAADPRTSWPQWFDTWSSRDFSLREDISAPGLRESVPAVTRLLAAEAARLHGRWDRVVLAGISMGAAAGAHVLFNLDVPEAGGGRLAAFMGFSGRCPFAGRSLGEIRGVLALEGGPPPGHERVLLETPVLIEHSVVDPQVPVRNGRALRDTLLGFGAQVEWKEYSDGGHWFNSPTGMDDAVEFLNKHVMAKGDSL